MQAGELVHLAALAAAHGPQAIARAAPLPAASLQAYWSACKCRLDRWGRSLKLAQERARFSRRRADAWRIAKPVLEEILLSEVLARVWAGVLCAHDKQHGEFEAEPVARSVLDGQLEARLRSLTLMMHAPGVRGGDAVKLNRLRRQTERWSDLLIGNLSRALDVLEFAPNPTRAREFAQDFAEDARSSNGARPWPLLTASLHATFPQTGAGGPGNSDLNRRIGMSVLECLPSESFAETQFARPWWSWQMQRSADDAEQLLAQAMRRDVG